MPEHATGADVVSAGSGSEIVGTNRAARKTLSDTTVVGTKPPRGGVTSVSPPASIPELVSRGAHQYGDHAALVEGSRVVSYSDLHNSARATAKAFLASGVRLGDSVALWIPNRIEFVVTLLGAQLIGAAVVPLNTRYRGREASAILRRSRARALIVADGFLDTDYLGMLNEAGEYRPGQLVAGLDHLHTVVDLNEGKSAVALGWNEFQRRAESIDDETLRTAVGHVSPETPADILFTSGTTGQPKGVVSTHRQTIRVAADWAFAANLSPQDRYAVVNPLFHSFGYKAGAVTSLLSGSTIYPVCMFEPVALLEMIQRERITVLPGPPTIFTTLINHPRLADYDTSSLRFSIAGATTVPEGLFRDMRDILGFDSVAQAYGLTECPVVTVSRANEDPDHLAETTGPPVPGLEIRIADHLGDRAPLGADGEVLVRGESVMIGYFDDPEATAVAIDSRGWLHTGDIGRLDEHGCLKLTGRIKDMFIVGGFNVYPAEVEQVLSSHPMVVEAAVIGVPDARLGAVGQGFVVLLPGGKLTDAELRAYSAERLANFKVPRAYTFVEELPRNATGKVLKTELLVQFEDSGD
jgi:HIP---CoA ligase